MLLLVSPVFMMHYIGIDIVEIPRIEQAVNRWGERFLRRVYTGLEIDTYRHQLPSLAARFAGKEAVIKALSTPNISLSFTDIEILSGTDGKPLAKLYGQVQAQANRLGLGGITITLSHSREYAIAAAIGEAK
jgi:holo-[acyl-carrier protein] synthase